MFSDFLQAAGQQQYLRRGVQRHRRGAHPGHPRARSLRGRRPWRPVRGRQRGAGPGHRAELRALDRGIRLRHLPAPRPDQRPRGRGCDRASRPSPPATAPPCRPPWSTTTRRSTWPSWTCPISNLTPLHFAGSANPGDNAVVAGYPLDATNLHLVPARIGGIQNAQGPNIYETSTVTRQIYEDPGQWSESGNLGRPAAVAAGHRGRGGVRRRGRGVRHRLRAHRGRGVRRRQRGRAAHLGRVHRGLRLVRREVLLSRSGMSPGCIGLPARPLPGQRAGSRAVHPTWLGQCARDHGRATTSRRSACSSPPTGTAIHDVRSVQQLWHQSESVWHR